MPFEPFTSKAIRIPYKDIDTDQIIPAAYLKVTDKAGLAEGCFAEFKKDPQFPMNRPEFAQANVIIAGPNFGCGSSREHAPWALTQSGITAVISAQFADIFKGNAEKNGLLPIRLPAEVVEQLLNAEDELFDITIDLPAQTVSALGESWQFDITPFAKMRFLEGLSDTDYLAKLSDKIRAFEQARKPRIPSVR